MDCKGCYCPADVLLQALEHPRVADIWIRDAVVWSQCGVFEEASHVLGVVVVEADRDIRTGVPGNHGEAKQSFNPMANMFRCTIVRSFQRANPAMLKKNIYVVSVIHRV